MRRSWTLVIIALSACVSSSRVARLEARISAAEAAQAKAEFELRASQARIEAMLEQLAGSVADAADAADRADELREKVDALTAGAGAARPAPPPARPEPDPTKTYAVPVAGMPVKGKATALVTIVRAGEYACPFCERVRATLDQLQATYGDQVRIVYRQFVVHPTVATYAAQAACAANHQGKFWELDKLLWDEAFAKRAFEPVAIDALATRAGLDMGRYQADVGPCAAEVGKDQAEMARFGVDGTPAFFINGRYLAGAQPVQAFQAIIDEELTKAKAAVKRGVKPAKYYEQEIVKKGQPSL